VRSREDCRLVRGRGPYSGRKNRLERMKRRPSTRGSKSSILNKQRKGNSRTSGKRNKKGTSKRRPSGMGPSHGNQVFKNEGKDSLKKRKYHWRTISQRRDRSPKYGRTAQAAAPLHKGETACTFGATLHILNGKVRTHNSGIEVQGEKGAGSKKRASNGMVKKTTRIVVTRI